MTSTVITDHTGTYCQVCENDAAQGQPCPVCEPGAAPDPAPREAVRATTPPARHPGTVAVQDAAPPAVSDLGAWVRDDGKINGARVLAQGYGWLQHMAYWDNPWTTITATLYAASAHATTPRNDEEGKGGELVWLTMPRLFYTSANAEGGTGKSVKARLTGALCPDPKRITEMTKAYMIEQMAKRRTVIVTEMDNVVGTTGRRTSWLPGLLNVGFEFDGATGRKQNNTDVDVPLFGAAIIDGKDLILYYPPLRTLWARCLVIRSERGPNGYRAPRYDREMRAFAHKVRGRLSRWMAQEVDDGIGDHTPAVPEGLGNRPLDIWWNMFAVADRAGGPWPALAREACKRVESVTGIPEQDRADDAAIQARVDGWGSALPQLPGSDDGEDLEP